MIGDRADAVNGNGGQHHVPTRPSLSIVVPTKEEADNIAPLLERLAAVAASAEIEVVFVDDSDDDTADAIRLAAGGFSAPVVLVRRNRDQRAGGLATAVVKGFERAQGTWVCVMDADLQHPPELVLDLLRRAQEGDVDLVIASRHTAGGGTEDFGPVRSFLSYGSGLLARLAFPRALAGVTDPMSGFFLVRRDVLPIERLRPQGFKILLEVLVRTPGLRKAEVPFTFAERNAGRSKANLAEARKYLGHLWRLRVGETSARFTLFAIVGLSGLLVNTLLLAAFTEVGHLYYLLSAVLATQGSTLWNFALTERWVFQGGDRKHGKVGRFIRFAAINNAALAARGPLLYVFASLFGIQYLVANVLSLLLLTILRFGLADTWIWRTTTARRAGRFFYDVHGIISVVSDVALPELERFTAPSLESGATIDVRIGSVEGGGGKAPFVSVERDTFVYDEGLGSWGFAVRIESTDVTRVCASKLLARSPHVLYTNVVEPLLRWTLAERGYALVHAACVASGDRAFLITARTDTGKTTTILKTLDANPALSFLSDDLVLLRADGTLLAYPKPLTISSHTVAAVKRAVLNPRERLALVLQSRVHSRTGRSFAFLLTKYNLPVATINAIVQLIVPPPKYHVDRLVPDVVVSPQAHLEGVIVIERSEDREEKLTPEETVRTILANCADAYGFPPYSHLERFLLGRSAIELAPAEEALIRDALADRSATLLASSTRDWWQRVPEVMGIAVPALTRVEDDGFAPPLQIAVARTPLLTPEGEG
jgi:glycosyltransferase involved in cell wall biosynthesis